MACEEKMRLIEEYMRAASELSDALRELHLKALHAAPERHGQLQGIVAECEIKLKEARVAFEEHGSRHCC